MVGMATLTDIKGLLIRGAKHCVLMMTIEKIANP